MAPRKGNKRMKKETSNGHNEDLNSLFFLTWFVEFVKHIAEHSSPPDRFEGYCEISVTKFKYICSLVMEHMSKSGDYKVGDGKTDTVMPFYTKVATAIRRLKSGKSLSSIGKEIKTHSFSVQKVTDSLVEALVENGLHHLPRLVAEEEMDPNALARLTEEWKVLSTESKLNPEKRPNTILACSILHNIVHDVNV